MESTTYTHCRYIIYTVVASLGLYFYVAYRNAPPKIEGIENKSVRCPNLLVQKHGQYYLYNTKIAEVPGVNPIVFANLEDYVEFLDWQHKIGIRCPVMYAQSTNNAQGEQVHKIRPSTTNLHGGASSTPQPSKQTTPTSPLHTQLSSMTSGNSNSDPTKTSMGTSISSSDSRSHHLLFSQGGK